jgi:alpha-tubulin suppressor-like RCC1 family protein
MGNNTSGQLGDSTTSSRSSPVQVGGSWNNIASVYNSIYGIKTDSTLWSWGDNTSGRLAHGNTNNLQSSPVQIGTSSWSQVSAFGTTMLAKRIDNTLWVAGSNIGDGTTFGRSTPVQLTGYSAGNLSIVQPSQVVDISGFADQNNNIYVWGNNNTSGVHGDGTTIAKYIPTPVLQFANVSSPTQVTTGSWSQVAAGAYHSLAIKSDGGLYGWGLNDRGQIGAGIVSVINWTKIVGDLTQTYGIRSDGTLWGWGNNAAGQLGQTNVTNRSSPVQIGLGTFSDVASGDAHVLAVTTDGKLLGWGKNDYGQAGALSWAQISASQDPAPFMFAIRSDGALFSWGRNNFGQLGDSTTTDRSSPVVLDTNSWSQVSAGVNHVLAKRNDGLLFAWGLNNAGQLGDFSTVARSSPIQIGNAYPSLSFNGSNEYYTVAPNTTLAFGAVDWTIEMWVFLKGYAATSTTLYDTRPAGTGSTATYQLINISSTGFIGYSSGAVVSDGIAIVPLNQWNHIAVSRQGSSTRLFLNGVQVGTTITDSVSYIVGASRPIIGSDGNVPNSAGYNFNGLMSNIRIVKGVAVYTGNFTVPTSPLEATQSAGTNISAITAGQTSLLTGQGLFDRSGNNLTISPFGTATAAPVTPFASVDKLVGRNVLQLSAGDSTSMAIGSDNTLWVWGLNASGQLGQNNTVNRSSPVQVTGSWSSVTAYSSHAAAITTDNRLFTWGLNTSGQLGVNDVVTRSSPVQVDGSWINVDVGFNHTIAITTDNTLFTWGNNQLYQLGDTTTINRSSPTQIAGSWSIVKAGASTSAAIDTTNKLYTWGNNASGQLGVAPMSWTMALNQAMVRSNGVVYIWGQNAYGEVGDGTTIQRSSPIQLGSTSWTVISKTGYVVMGIKPDYTLWAWGINNLGSLGDGTTISRSSPVQIGIDKSWMNIFVGQNRSYAKDSTGIIWAAGSNDAGQLGDGTTIDRSSPVQINATSGSWSVISAGVSHTLALDSLGQLYGWGRNVEGQINNSPLTFAQIGNGVALRADNQLWVWGNNGGGALGDGATANRSSPVQIAGLWKSAQLRGAAATYPAGNGIRTDGTLWGWGTNTYGGIGDNSTISRSSPVQIGTDTNWLRVFGIDDANFAIKTDYTLWAWGNNNAGQLAQSDTVNRSSPVQIAGSWSLISANGGTAFGIQTDGTLWAWGVNAYGELGQNDRVYRSSPVQVGTRSWTSVSVTYNLVAAIRNDGGLFTWGHPTNGSMGDTTTIDRSSPVQLGTSSWTQVATTHGGVAAIRLDGGVFTWGSVTGVPSTLRSSPVQLGTSSWTQVTSGYFTIHGVTSDNRFFTWSTQGYPQGDNTTVAKSSPVLTVATQTNLSAVLVPAYSIPTQIGNRSWSLIAAGWQHSIGVTTDNTLWGWGLNTYGQVGDTSTANRSSPVQVSIASGYSWAQISANQSATAALTTTGALWTWGINNAGQLGLNIANTVNRSSPVQVGTSSWISISTSTNNMYAVDLAYRLFTWGNGAFGALGDNQTVSRSSPALVGTNLETLIVSPVQVGNSSWSMLAATGYMMAGVTSPPAILYAWGVNTYGQLGMADAVTRSSPVQVIAGPVIPNRSSPVQIASGSWSQVTAGNSFSGAIRSDGMLFMWGINSSGQIGDGTTLNRSYPVQISTSSWVEVGSGTSHAIATMANNSVWTWGNNQYGQLGQNDNANRSNPIQVTSSSFSQISSGANHVVGLIGNAIYGWGDNSFGQLGRSLSPVIWDTVIMGQTSYGLKNGNLYAWGYAAVAATYAGYGDGTTVNKSSPVQIGTSADKYTLLASNLGAAHIVAVKPDNTIWAWGINSNGQLGDGTVVTRSSPVQILAKAPGVSKLVLGAAYTLMLTTGGTLFGWGLNTNGQLGQNDTVARSSPVQIATNVIDIAACNLAAAYIRNDNTLWTWGGNSDGGLAVNDLVFRSSPVQVAGNWKRVVGAATNFAFLRNDNTLWTAGVNASGQLGDNTTINRSTPTQIATGGMWQDVVASHNGPAFMAKAQDNSIWVWGTNTVNGILGVGDTLNRSAPTQIFSKDVNASFFPQSSIYFSLKINNLLYAWGLNNVGQLGMGNIVARSAPMQVGIATDTQQKSITLLDNNNYTKVSAGAQHTVALRSNGTAWVFGQNTFGQLGQVTDTISRSSPTQINAGQSYSTVFGLGSQTRLASDSATFVAGNNAAGRGELGTGDTVARSSPVQLSAGTSVGAGDNTYVLPLRVGLSSWSQVSGGYSHTIAIRTDSTLWAWGYNVGGPLGQGTTVSRSSPVQIGTSSWASVSAGNSFNTAIRIDNTLWTWGLNTSGQLGDNTTSSRSSPVQLAGLWIDSEAGNTFAGAIAINNTVWTWGANGSGVLGNTSLIARSSPVQVGTDTFKVLSLTENSVSAIDSYSNLETWGDNLYGQLGNNGSYYSWSILSGAGNYFTAIRSDGTLWTWGENTYGQLGNNTTNSRSSPTQIGTSSWTNVRAGNSHVVAIRADGTNWTWGFNTSGQVGDGTSINRSSPVQISTSFTDIAAGDTHTLAITSDGTLYAWGNNSSLQLGIYDAFSRSSPTQVPTSVKFKSLSAGTSHSLAIATDDTLYGWGSNLYGQVGKSTATFTVSGTATTMNAPGFITSQGKLYAWGINNNGQLGDNTTINKLSPVQIGALTTWSKIIPTFSNNNTFGFFKTDNTLWVSGNNSNGQLGQTDTITRSSPVQLSAGAGRSWTSFVFGTSFGIGIKDDGSLWTVGDNVAGQLGDGTLVNRSSPVQIGTSSWSQVSAGNGVAGALMADGTLWTWGSGNLGGLAGGTTVYRSSPAQIGTGYASVYITDQGGHAITTLGQLVVWGWNASGNLGDSTTVNKSGLTTIAGSWTQVASNGFYSRAGIRSDGTLWTWGENSNGQLGTGDTVSRSSPVQISGGGSWTLVTNIASGSYAARKIDGSIWSWGGNPGDNTNNRSSPVQIYASAMTPQVFNEPTQVSTSTWNVISAGALFSTAIRSDNKLFSWGNNNLGQLGVSYSYNQIAATSIYGTTILTQNNQIWQTGYNLNGGLGDNTILSRSSPVQVGVFGGIAGTNRYTQVASGYYGTIAIKDDSTLWSWGYNTDGSVGDGTTIARSSPVQISTGSWQFISTTTDTGATSRTSYAIRDNGTLWLWGSNSSGQLGDGTSNNRSSPVQLGLDTWRFVTGSLLTTAAIRTDYTLWMWGNNTSGKLGDSTTVAKNSPIQVAGSWSQVSIGGYASHVVALDMSGRLFTWGFGAAGQLGSGTAASRSSPLQVGTLSYISVAAGTSMTAAIDFSNRLYVWGAGTAGNLGDGTTVGKSSPIQIAADKQWLSVVIGGDRVTAITTDKQIWMWGSNVYGAFGDNTTTYRSSPVQISAFTPNYPLSSPTQVGTSNWSDITAGSDFTAAIRTNGSLYAWGNNASGPLMAGTTNSRSSPVQVGGNLSYVHVSSGYSTLLVVNTNDPLQGNKLIASGAGTAGQLGDNTIVSKNLPTAVLFSIADNKSNPTQITSDDYTGYYQSSPVQVGSESWNLVSAGENHSLGIKSSGLLFAWGYNQNGQVGDSTTINKSSPVQISTATTWVEAEAGYNHNAVEKSDGSAYTFGNNNDGQLGDGT